MPLFTSLRNDLRTTSSDIPKRRAIRTPGHSGVEDAALLTEEFFELHWQTYRTTQHLGIAWPQPS